MANQEVFIALQEKFDWEKVIVDNPVTHKFTRGKSTVEWTTSSVYVRGENNSKLPIYFELAEQNLWGVYGIWPVNLSKEEQTDNKFEGFQVCYPMIRTNFKPNKVEKWTQRIFDIMGDITIEALKKFSEARKVPKPTYSAYLTA